MNLYFIQEHAGRRVFHGGIGNVDAEKVFLQKGFLPLRFPYHYSFSLKAKMARAWYLIKIGCLLPKHSCIIFQFPLYARMNKLLITLMGFRKSIRIICFITDIDGIKDGNDALLEKEIEELRRYRYFIVHNEVMKQWLLSMTTLRHAACINFFDFLISPVDTPRVKSLEIVFAGNLEKSGFLDELGKLMQNAPLLIFNIYGKDPPASLLLQGNVHYKGFTDPYLLPAIIHGSFGLVWDGSAIDGPAGSLGIYMHYISHHKLSLYIVSGLPVIACSNTASAALVAQYKIGFSVNSLYDIETIINTITAADYQEMVMNTKQLAALISRGEMLGNAIEEILKIQSHTGTGR